MDGKSICGWIAVLIHYIILHPPPPPPHSFPPEKAVAKDLRWILPLTIVPDVAYTLRQVKWMDVRVKLQS